MGPVRDIHCVGRDFIPVLDDLVENIRRIAGLRSINYAIRLGNFIRHDGPNPDLLGIALLLGDSVRLCEIDVFYMLSPDNRKGHGAHFLAHGIGIQGVYKLGGNTKIIHKFLFPFGFRFIEIF